MIGSALGLAGVVASAVCNAVVSPLLADEEREGLRVLCDIGYYAVFANASVGQSCRVARVFFGRHGGNAWLLEADEGTLGDVLVTPESSVRL